MNITWGGIKSASADTPPPVVKVVVDLKSIFCFSKRFFGMFCHVCLLKWVYNCIFIVKTMMMIKASLILSNLFTTGQKLQTSTMWPFSAKVKPLISI